MAGKPEDHTLCLLRRMDAKLDLLADPTREIKTCVGLLEQSYASLSNRIDLIGTRLERIERRLDLVDAE